MGISQLLYVKNTGYNHTDQNYQINGQYSLTPRFNVSLNTSFISDSTAKQEYPHVGVDYYPYSPVIFYSRPRDELRPDGKVVGDPELQL